MPFWQRLLPTFSILSRSRVRFRCRHRCSRSYVVGVVTVLVLLLQLLLFRKMLLLMSSSSSSSSSSLEFLFLFFGCFVSNPTRNHSSTISVTCNYIKLYLWHRLAIAGKSFLVNICKFGSVWWLCASYSNTVPVYSRLSHDLSTNCRQARLLITTRANYRGCCQMLDYYHNTSFRNTRPRLIGRKGALCKPYSS